MMSHWGDISNKYCGGEIEGNQQNVYFLIKRTYISDFKVSYGEDSIVGKDTTCCRSGINFSMSKVICTTRCYATKLNRDERTRNETMLHV